MYRRVHPGADSAKHVDTTRYYTDKGRVVYGGGGIEPDILIPEDTGVYTTFILNAFNSGEVYDFSFDFADRYRQYIRMAYPEYRSFASDSKLDHKILAELYQWLSRRGIKSVDHVGEAMLLGRAKAYIARNVWNSEAYHFLLTRNDKAVLRALEILR
jgi:carboxyl-terminal processing protease